MIAIDANILVYAFDQTEQAKHVVCSRFCKEVFQGKKQAAITNQVLAEFAVVVTKKVKRPLEKRYVRSILETILASPHWKVLDYSGATLAKALSLPHSFWDALIIQTLRDNGVTDIMTENVKDFANSGLNVHNPFSASHP